jgi:hypothetical protein
MITKTSPLLLWIPLACVLAIAGIAVQVDQVHASAALALDPSIRASGMGKASTALFWGWDASHWRNPALLGYQRGIRYEWGKTQLVPDLADDVYLTTDHLTLAAWGVGLALEGRPFDELGGTRLSYGETEAVDQEGNSYGTFESWEEVNSWGIGVSALQLLDAGFELADVDVGPLHRFGDLSFGMRENKAEVLLMPQWVLDSLGFCESGKAEATTRDRGYLLRVTPYNSIDFAGFIPTLDALLDPVCGGVCIEGAYGEATQNYRNDTITWLVEPEPISKFSRKGWSVHAAIGFPGAIRTSLEENGLGWLAQSLTPLVSWGKAWDRSVRSWKDPASGEVRELAEVEYSGWELTFANLVTIRRGWIHDRQGAINGATSGWGLGFNMGNLGGFRYDKATVPQALDLEDVNRKSFTIFVDPPAVWRAVRSGPPRAGS